MSHIPYYGEDEIPAPKKKEKKAGK